MTTGTAELTTLPEFFVALFRKVSPQMPYSLAVGLWVLTLGPGLSILSTVLQSLLFLWSNNSITSFTPGEIANAAVIWLPRTPLTLAGLLVGYLSLAYTFYGTRFIKTRVLDAEEAILPLSGQSKQEYRKLFARISAIRPQIAITMIWIGTVSVFIPFFSYGPSFWSPAITVSLAWSFIINLVGLSFIWTYYSTLKAVREIGRRKLGLSSYYVDPFLGLRPIGSLASNVTMAYFVLLGIGSIADAAAFLTLGESLPFLVGVSILSSSIVFTLLGLLFFLFPLWGFHKRLVHEKKVALDDLTRKRASVLQSPTNSVDELVQLARLEFAERAALAIHEWPFDTKILKRLVALVVPIMTSQLARLVQAILRT